MLVDLASSLFALIVVILCLQVLDMMIFISFGVSPGLYLKRKASEFHNWRKAKKEEKQ